MWIFDLLTVHMSDLWYDSGREKLLLLNNVYLINLIKSV